MNKISSDALRLIVGLRRRQSPIISRDALSEACSLGLLEYDDGGFTLTQEGKDAADAALNARLP